MRKIVLSSIFSFFVLFLTTAFADENCNMNQVNRVFDLITERALLMKQVAAVKYVTGGNIYDANQEIKVLDGAKHYAKENHLDVDSFLIFTQIQMDVSKQIENHWTQYWQKYPERAPKREAITSLSQLRAKLVEITKALNQAINQAIPSFKGCDHKKVKAAFELKFAQVKGISAHSNYQAILFDSLKHIKASK